MSVMTSHFLRVVDPSETQNSNYPGNKTLFFLRINKSIHYTLRAYYAKILRVSGGGTTFKDFLALKITVLWKN